MNTAEKTDCGVFVTLLISLKSTYFADWWIWKISCSRGGAHWLFPRRSIFNKNHLILNPKIEIYFYLPFDYLQHEETHHFARLCFYLEVVLTRKEFFKNFSHVLLHLPRLTSLLHVESSKIISKLLGFYNFSMFPLSLMLK